MVDQLKGLLGINDGSQDMVIQFILDDVQETILNYCNIKAIPDGLKNTVLRMAIDLYRYDRPGESGAPTAVSSVTTGNTSTSFTSTADALKGGILKNYEKQLNRYRKVVW